MSEISSQVSGPSYSDRLANLIIASSELPKDLPQNIVDELKRLDELFVVDTTKLKQITDRFVGELVKGEHS